MEAGGSGSLKSEINVTPLVDVMLVVLIIFMLVTPLLQKGVAVSLPKARNVHSVPESQQEALIVTVKQGGELYLGGETIGRAELVRALGSRLELNPGLELQIKADRNARYGEVKRIIQAGQEAGFAGAALVAERIRAEAR